MDKILLVGSSIFELWANAAAVAPDALVINRAVGGTITLYWTEHLAGVLASVDPDVVLFYCGSNDINNDISDEEILANTARCRELVCAYSSDVRFAYCSIIKAPQKLGHWDRIDRINEAICTSLQQDDLYVDTNDLFFPEGHPLEYFFVEDGLHLTDAAYDALVAYTRPLVVNWIEM